MPELNTTRKNSEWRYLAYTCVGEVFSTVSQKIDKLAYLALGQNGNYN